jgi:hypothetical protein
MLGFGRMPNKIDTTFNVYSDTPSGKDPDSHSQSLRRYHKSLWSKTLPTGAIFDLSVEHPKSYLHHESSLGRFSLSSDSIGHTYRNVKSMAPIIHAIPVEELDHFFSVCSTIGAYLVFPSRKIDRKPTINGARGLHWKIKDRFDLTLECIRLYYLHQDSPLHAVLTRYSDFFDLFGSFKGYSDFFLLQDLLINDGTMINFFVNFDGFEDRPLPPDIKSYRHYRDSVVTFVSARNHRIERQVG